MRKPCPNQMDREKALKLWFNGLLDSEIAKELGCNKVTVHTWRTKNSLPSNRGIFSWDKGDRVEGKKKVVCV